MATWSVTKPSRTKNCAAAARAVLASLNTSRAAAKDSTSPGSVMRTTAAPSPPLPSFTAAVRRSWKGVAASRALGGGQAAASAARAAASTGSMSEPTVAREGMVTTGGTPRGTGGAGSTSVRCSALRAPAAAASAVSAAAPAPALAGGTAPSHRGVSGSGASSPTRSVSSSAPSRTSRARFSTAVCSMPQCMRLSASACRYPSSSNNGLPPPPPPPPAAGGGTAAPPVGGGGGMGASPPRAWRRAVSRRSITSAAVRQ